ncbi:hypothetical protein [Nocardioides terrisoli]|uniref:hypothetical protein n=1 Tax=Nocardioides terrisoli TaxID=3388267 RepID=UPI00287BC740|nr:hypothetical protein [Nocardioides marmorisolisilvae]
MRSRIPHLLLVAVLATLAAVLTVAPADAAARVQHDTRGDAPAKYDVVRVGYHNGARRFRGTIDLRHLTQQRTALVLSLKDGAGNRYFTTAVRKPGGIEHRHFLMFPHHFDADTVPALGCKGLSVRWRTARSTVTVTIPRACLRDAKGLTAVLRTGDPRAERAADRTARAFVRYR